MFLMEYFHLGESDVEMPDRVDCYLGQVGDKCWFDSDLHVLVLLSILLPATGLIYFPFNLLPIGRY